MNTHCELHPLWGKGSTKLPLWPTVATRDGQGTKWARWLQDQQQQRGSATKVNSFFFSSRGGALAPPCLRCMPARRSPGCPGHGKATGKAKYNHARRTHEVLDAVLSNTMTWTLHVAGAPPHPSIAPRMAHNKASEHIAALEKNYDVN